MRALDRYNPIAVAIYYLAVMGISMLCMHPILLLISLAGAMSACALYRSARPAQHALFWGIFALTALLNPLLSRHGATVLLVLGDKPVTLEALVWGLVAGLGIVSVLYWVGAFGALMTEDKLLYLFGKLSPRISLLLSMALRYIALFSEQSRKIRQSQRALGLYKQDNILDRLRGEARIFSILLSWALENGIITANSMAARGYGTGRRTHFSRFTWRAHDTLLLTLSLALTAATVTPLLLGKVTFTAYPTLQITGGTLPLLTYLFFGVLVALPILIETEDTIKWKYLRSKI